MWLHMTSLIVSLWWQAGNDRGGDTSSPEPPFIARDWFSSAVFNHACPQNSPQAHTQKQKKRWMWYYISILFYLLHVWMNWAATNPAGSPDTSFLHAFCPSALNTALCWWFIFSFAFSFCWILNPWIKGPLAFLHSGYAFICLFSAWEMTLNPCGQSLHMLDVTAGVAALELIP